jgi:hypothetical protein
MVPYRRETVHERVIVTPEFFVVAKTFRPTAVVVKGRGNKHAKTDNYVMEDAKEEDDENL